MDKSELAKLMLEWETTKKKLDELADEIKFEVVILGKSQEAGNVKVRYSEGRKTYDYKEAIERAELSDDLLAPYEKVTRRIDYRKACGDLCGADVPFEMGEPSVSIKLVE